MAAESDRLSFAQFIAWEARQEAKYEFADGEIVAMSGVTGDHTRIADNVRTRLNGACSSPCYAYGSDRKVRVPKRDGTEGARYPDATVTCSESDHGKALIIESPVVILEVLSDTSVSTDMVKELREYTSLATLEQYVLIDSRERWAMSYVRRGNMWDADLCLDDIIKIRRFGVVMAFDEAYVGTSLAQRPREATSRKE